MPNRKPQAVRRDHLHLYQYWDGRCSICGETKPEPGLRRWITVEAAIFIGMFLFIAWAIFVVLYLQYWRQ